ncbi:hypothetical protein [Phenylobacterium sp.]|uniref:hypothetical protein n=1 Tax=Phenylobacterium sp. TaxID=1871053 RepID=UPI0039839215
MGKYGSADQPAAFSRWIVLAPLAVSLVAMQPKLWGWDACGDSFEGVCKQAFSIVSWIGTGFPHFLIFPLVWAVSLPVGFSIILAMDIVLGLAAWRFLPPRVTAGRLVLIYACWIAVTVAVVLVTPYLMFLPRGPLR